MTREEAALAALAECVSRCTPGHGSPHASTFAWPGDVARTMRYSEGPTRRLLNGLVEKGFVSRERKHAGGHRFRITTAGWAALEPPRSPRSYPDVTTNPVDPPTVSGTDISRDVG